VFDNFAPGEIFFIKFLDEHPDITKLMYADAVSSTVKDALKELMTRVIEHVYKLEVAYFSEEEEFKVLNNFKVEEKIVPKSALARFLRTFSQSFIAEKNKDLSKPLDYFKLVHHLI
jgi:hypothetical protein